MEVKELQKKIVEHVEAWDKKRGVLYDEELAFTHLVEEIGEMAHEYISEKARRDEYNADELKNAIGDTLIQLARLANLRGLDIEETVLKILEEDKP